MTKTVHFYIRRTYTIILPSIYSNPFHVLHNAPIYCHDPCKWHKKKGVFWQFQISRLDWTQKFSSTLGLPDQLSVRKWAAT